METKSKRGRPRVLQSLFNKRVQLEQTQAEALAAAAEKKGVAASVLIRQFIEQGLAQCT